MGVRVAEKEGSENGVPQIEFSMEGSDYFSQRVMTLSSGNFFDQPPAARTLLGIFETMNRLADEESSSVYLENSENGLV